MMDCPATNKSEKKFLSNFSLNDFLLPWKTAYTWSLEDFVLYAKYITVFPLARSRFVLEEQELPTCPNGFSGSAVFFQGRLKKFIMNRVLASHAKNNLQFLWAWQNAKRGCNKVPEEFIELAKEKHSKTLKTPFEYRYDFLEDDEPMFCGNPNNPTESEDHSLSKIHEDALEMIDLFLETLVPNGTNLSLDWDREASSSASFESKRSAGGAREFLREIHSYDPFNSFLVGMKFHPRVGTFEVRTDLPEPFSTRSLRCRLDFDSLDQEISLGQGLIPSKLPVDRNLKASVACVCEPLKVRVLTKGESVPQFVAKPLQEFLWRSLRNFDIFRLIGEPVEPYHIKELLDRDRSFYATQDPDRRFMVSGDYSAATDGLNPWLSPQILERVCAKLQVPLWYEENCLKVLGMHELEYPAACWLNSVQKRGQLMGSVLSFPILCILNLITYLLSHRKELRVTLNLMRLLKSQQDRIALWNTIPVLINGDDIFFCSEEAAYHRWCSVLSHVGFKKSLGKNLVSRRFCTINTQMFNVRRRGNEFDVVLVRYMNIGLLRGQSKVNNRGAINQDSPIWDIHNFLYDNCSNIHLMTSFFFFFNREKIEGVTSFGRFSLYLPRSLGGCGFKGDPGYFTKYQVKLGSYLYRRHRHDGEILKEDLGLVSKTLRPLIVVKDPYQTCSGRRVPKFDVPERGYIVKPPALISRSPNGSPFVEVELRRRFPIELPKETRAVKDVKKLTSFTDDLKEVIRVTGAQHLQKNIPDGGDMVFSFTEYTDDVNC